ncbi:ATP-binding cassette domain-containing protein (plasmid) [Pseudoalteromonas sp. T1lg65]|uniref:ATP-binding cassette domain-containing protein n=1 Tax=Pseudoalteromonas sp. T1lg65 TaxID=2077101 RepID=UPI003F78FFB7
MPSINLKNLCYQLPSGRVLLEDVTQSISGTYSVLTGPNGSGKSHLLELIARRLSPLSGTVHYSSNVFYLPQNAVAEFNTLAEMLGLCAQLAALKRAQAGGASVQDIELINDQWLLEQEWQTRLAPMGVCLETPFTDYSPGEKMRVFLEVLFSHSWFLLLDEPSNHLDQSNRNWLTEQLRQYQHGALVVTHDAKIIDNAQQILHLESSKLRCFGPGLQLYRDTLSSEAERLISQHQQQKQQLKTLKVAVQEAKQKHQQQNAKGAANVRSGSQSKMLGDFKAQRVSRRLSQQTRLLSREVETLKKQSVFVNTKQENRFYFAEYALEREKIGMHQAVLHQGISSSLSFLLTTTQKLRVTGDNGSGKSTLLRTLAGEYDVKEGVVYRPKQPFYVDQYCSCLPKHKPLIEYAKTRLNKPEAELRTCFANVGLNRLHVESQIKLLSGGEKVKAAIVIAAMSGSFMLLDEPDNHLDLNSQEDVAALLNKLPNGFVLVSHNEYFCGRLSNILHLNCG